MIGQKKTAQQGQKWLKCLDTLSQVHKQRTREQREYGVKSVLTSLFFRIHATAGYTKVMPVTVQLS